MQETKKTEKEIEKEAVKEKHKKKKRKAKRSKKYGINVKSKKKEAVARAVIKTGKGRITLNKRNIEFIEPEYVREMIFEPIKLAGDAIKEVDIKINTKGGGFMGQAVTARSAIAKAIVEYTNDKKLKEKFIKYDRLLMVDDHRRVEPKKPLGKKARKKRQSSKR
jgi:small subunit ribosomal protein S9